MEFVTFEIAKKLNEIGFDYPCIDAFNRFGCTYRNGWCEYLDDRNDEFITLADLHEGDYLLPTISQVLKWLRENHNLHISTKPYPCEDGLMWMYEVRKFSSVLVCVVANKTGFQEPEQAALAGIDYVLDNLI